MPQPNSRRTEWYQPSYNAADTLTGYRSGRRVPERDTVRTVAKLYADLCPVEQSLPQPAGSPSVLTTLSEVWPAGRRH